MDLVKDIKDRLQFFVTIEIFFSGLIFSFYKAIGVDDLVSNKNISMFAIGIIFPIVSYLLVGGLEKSKEKRILAWIRNSITLNLVLFILPIIVLASTVHEDLPGWYEWPFKVSFYGMLYMPMVTSFMIFMLFFSKITTEGCKKKK